MIYLKTDEEIELLRKANLLVSGTLAEIAKIVRPGITTLEMDALAEQYIRDNGAVPTFKGFPNPNGPAFPASICTSVNDVVVHGIPDSVPLKEGDIVSVDCGTYIDGFAETPVTHSVWGRSRRKSRPCWRLPSGLCIWPSSSPMPETDSGI